MRAGTLGEFLADAGAVVGGSAALGATLLFVGASVAHDLGADVDPDKWARVGALYGGLAGFVIFLEGA